MLGSQFWKWVLGLSYIVAVASIWIAASFVVQTVVDDGVSPFLITYIFNSLFVIYVPLFEIVRYLEDAYGSLWFWRKKNSSLQESADSEEVVLLGESELRVKDDSVDLDTMEDVEISRAVSTELNQSSSVHSVIGGNGDTKLDAKGQWSRVRMAKSNTILSSSSSLFTFLVALVFLGESFTWPKHVSVLLCMLGAIIVSVVDSDTGLKATASNPLLGDILVLVSSGFYAAYITLIRKKLPDEDGNDGRASMIQFLGYLGFFNLLIFLPVALILNFTKLEPFSTLTWKQFGLVVGKGLLDNVVSDYLWAKAVLLTSTTVATAGLTIQVPLAAIVDSVMGNIPGFLDFVGAAAIRVGFAKHPF